ncbi:STAS domain-containing protein [Actinoplanes sp. NPDC024001]|uniref:STAS domain-containing protein n=1 Tax=Actinoplanes sp. NPDC024001 TaxID=3154598 RepID=UPI0033F8C141
MGAAVLNVAAAQWSVRSAYPAGPTVLRIQGDLDAEVAPALQTCLEGGLERAADVLVDLSDVSLIDCVCLGVLLRAHHRARSLGLLLALAAPSPSVQRTLAATRVDRALHITCEVAPAVVALRRHALEHMWPERLCRRTRDVKAPGPAPF